MGFSLLALYTMEMGQIKCNEGLSTKNDASSDAIGANG